MTTTKRLSNEDIIAVFESVHNNYHPPPPHLQFQVVPPIAGSLKSPPSYEFEDGLYILLKPPPTKTNNHNSRRLKYDDDDDGNYEPEESGSGIPTHLMDYIIDRLPSSTTVKWSLSGPQFKQPTTIQLRYCTPKGNTSYSNQKAGTLWTMVSFFLLCFFFICM